MDVCNANLDSNNTACIDEEVAAVVATIRVPLVFTPGTEDHPALMVKVTGERNAAPHDGHVEHPPVLPWDS